MAKYKMAIPGGGGGGGPSRGRKKRKLMLPEEREALQEIEDAKKGVAIARRKKRQMARDVEDMEKKNRKGS